MREHDYLAHDALGLAHLVRLGEIQAAEVLECALARMSRLQPLLNMIAHRLEEAARKQLGGLDPHAAFAGVPFLLKDIGAALAGAPMTSGSRLFAGNVTAADSTLVSRYRAAGLIFIGKSSTPELGLSFTTEPLCGGPTHNPWALDRSPGGSSGGAAAAVASGIVPVAHASDGAGSIRLPAAHCGLFGFKPSRMRNPMGPVQGEGLAGMSAAHCVSRSVRDSAALLDASAGPEPGDPYAAPPGPHSYLEAASQDPRRLRIGVSVQAPGGVSVDADCADAARRAALLCEALGHDVEEAALDYDASGLGQAWRVIVGVSFGLAVRRWEASHPGCVAANLLEPVNALWLEEATRCSGFDYAAAVEAIRFVGRKVAASFERYDVMLTPAAASPAPRLGLLAGSDEDLDSFTRRFWSHGPFTAVYNATGGPAMSVPMGLSAEGLPTGAHFGAALGQDGVLMALAGQIERASPWSYEIPFRCGANR